MSGNYTYVVLQEKKRRGLLFPDCLLGLWTSSLSVPTPLVISTNLSLKYLYLEGFKFSMSRFNLFS